MWVHAEVRFFSRVRCKEEADGEITRGAAAHARIVLLCRVCTCVRRNLCVAAEETCSCALTEILSRRRGHQSPHETLHI